MGYLKAKSLPSVRVWWQGRGRGNTLMHPCIGLLMYYMAKCATLVLHSADCISSWLLLPPVHRPSQVLVWELPMAQGRT